MPSFNQRLRLCAIGLMVSVSLAVPETASAAQTVVLQYGIFRGSVPVRDLAEFAETGEASSRLRRYLRLAHQEPDQFRQYLSEEVTTDPKTLDLLLDSPAGDALLSEMGEYLSASRYDDRKALKVALTQAAADDGKLSLIELLQNYPTEKAYINVRRVVSTYQQFAALQERFGNVLNGRLGQILENIGL